LFLVFFVVLALAVVACVTSSCLVASIRSLCRIVVHNLTSELWLVVASMYDVPIDISDPFNFMIRM
jgi:hypothetical protein